MGLSVASAPPLRLRAKVRHRKVVATLVAVACLLAPVAMTAIWLRSQVLDTHVYVRTVSPLSSNQAIDAAVADEITKALFAHVDVAAEARRVLPAKTQFLALPLTAGLRGYTQTAVERFLRSAQFRQLWIAANRQAHEALVAALEGKRSPFIASDGSVDIDLADAVLAARQQLAVEGIHLFDKVKPRLLQRRFVIVRPHALARAHRAVRVLKALAIGLPALSLACLGLALALSRERRRTVLRVGVGLALTAALAVAALVVLRSLYLHQVVGTEVPKAAAGALYDTIVRNLRFGLRLAFLGGLAVAAGAALAGPSPLAVRVRTAALRTAGRLADEAIGESVTVTWVAANKPTLRTATVLAGLLLLLASSHPTVGLLVKLAIGVLVVLAGLEVLSRPAAAKRD